VAIDATPHARPIVEGFLAEAKRTAVHRFRCTDDAANQGHALQLSDVDIQYALLKR
jgi:hypothetical protein